MTHTRKTFSLAPMIGYTHKHFRTLARMLSSQAILYTEMLPAQAVVRNPNLHSLYMDTKFENPLACQISGNDANTMTEAGKILQEMGASEININVGCPSDKVQSGEMGACLMLKPELVADIFSQMHSKIKIPISIKCRLGVDDQDIHEDLNNFIKLTKQAGCNYYIIHARKAWLKGLSPKQNRDIPPLNYARVHEVKAQNPDLKIILNGGLDNLQTAFKEAQFLDGVMMGRALQRDIFLLSQVDELFAQPNTGLLNLHNLVSRNEAKHNTDSADFFRQTQLDSAKNIQLRQEVLAKYLAYLKQELASGQKLSMLIAPLLSFFYATKNARKVKTALTFARSLAELETAISMADFSL